MSKARLIRIMSVVMVVLALIAAVFNYLNEGRVTLKAVAGLLFFVAMALVLRSITRLSPTSSPAAPRTEGHEPPRP